MDDLTADEICPLVPPEPVSSDDVQIKVYKRRWYILALFSLFSFTQGAMWNTFGPISSTSEEAFGWDDATIAWLSDWGGVALLLTAFLFYWLMQVKGLRLAVLLSMFFLLLGSALRVITSNPKSATILIHIAQFISGLATPIAMGANPTVSAIWFPPQERVTATAISSSMGYFGVAITYVLGPLIVERGIPSVHNVTPKVLHFNEARQTVWNSSWLSIDLETNDNITEARIEKEREQIMLYMYIDCAWCGLLFIAILCYFPDAPRYPPSISANTGRLGYWVGLRSLLRNGHFMIIAFAYGISVGVYGAWQSVLNVNLKPTGISQKEAGWIGFYATVSSCTAAILVGRFADRFTRYMKVFISILYVLATSCFALFSFELLHGGLPHYNAILYVTVIGGGSFLLAATPMMFELACEVAYPASEASANGLLIFFNNLLGVLFLVPFAIPHHGTMWMNWVITGSCLVCIPLITAMKGGFNRLELDEPGAYHPESEASIQEETHRGNGSSRASNSYSPPRSMAGSSQPVQNGPHPISSSRAENPSL